MYVYMNRVLLIMIDIIDYNGKVLSYHGNNSMNYHLRLLTEQKTFPSLAYPSLFVWKVNVEIDARDSRDIHVRDSWGGDCSFYPLLSINL